MSEVGIRALKQNASAVIAEVVAGEAVTVTDRGRPVARIVPIVKSRLEQLREEGRLTPATKSISSLGLPPSGASIDHEEYERMREDRL